MSAGEFPAGFRLRQEREVEFGDVDMLRHANNARYVVWAETIRSVYLADVIGADICGRTGMILARHDLHYEAPLRYRERFVLAGRVARIGTKSFDFETVVWSLRENRRAFRGLATLVAYDYPAERSIAVPEAWRATIAAYEPAAG